MRLQYGLLLAGFVGLQVTASGQTASDLFDPSVLHQVHITMAAADWTALKAAYLTDTPFNVTSMQWNGAGSLTASVSNFQMHNRGHGSRSPIKPGLHLEFDANVKGQTFLGLSDLELKPNTQDPSMVHERISFLLFNRMGIPASRETHTRFYVNNEYIGVYLLVEYPDTNFLQRVFNENTGYEYNYIPGDWAGIPGGGYHFEYLGSDLSKYASNTDETPFNAETHTNAPDTVTLEGMIRTINQEPDATFLSAITPYLDLKLFLKHIAVETYVADFDCILGDVFGMNNFHFYRFFNKQLSQFIPWDKDNAFDWSGRPVLQNTNQNVLMRRLMAIPEYRNAYFDDLMTVTMLAGGSGGWLQQEAIREYNQIQQAAYEDPNKQYLDTGVLKLATNAQFDAANATVQAFPAARAAFVTTDVVNQGYQPGTSYPNLAAGGVISAAANAPAATGGLASIYGLNLGTAASSTVYINGYAAPVLFGSSGQMNVQVPWESSGAAATVGAVVNGQPSNILTAGLSTYSPGVFVVVHYTDGTVVTAANPAHANEVLIVYATGLGPVSGSMATGQTASLTALQPTTPQQATATVAGSAASVLFSGFTPGFIGLYQVNVQLPASFSAGPQTQLVVSIGGVSSPAFALPTQ